MGGYAWVTLATNDSYSLGALVLAHSLKQVGTKQQLAVLVTPGVTGAMRAKLQEVFNVVEVVDLLDSKDEANLRLLKRPELGVTFTKLHCWRLTQFDKCVFLDADTLVLENCDELFDREELSAAPDIGWPDCFNSGVFVYRPSNETFESLIQFALDKGSFDGGDQGLLNLYFSDWAHKDISKHLPFIYNMASTATYSYLPAFKQFGGDAKIIHFIGSSKPWLQYFDTETQQVHPSEGYHHLSGILQHWWNLFCSSIHPNLTSDMTIPSRTDTVHGSHSSFHQNISHGSHHDYQTYSHPTPNPAEDYQNVWDPWEEYDSRQLQIQSQENVNTSHVHDNQNQTYQQHDHVGHLETSKTESHNPPFVQNHNTESKQSSSHNLEVPSNHCPDINRHQGHNHDDKSIQNHSHDSQNPQSHHVSQYHENSFENHNQLFESHNTTAHFDAGHSRVRTPPPSPAYSQPHIQPTVHNDPPVIPGEKPSQITEPPPESCPRLLDECAMTTTVSDENILHTDSYEGSSQKDAGLAGAFAKLTLGAPRTAEQLALDDHLRRQGWEVGNVDYLGRDSFENIWSKICETISSGEPSAPKAKVKSEQKPSEEPTLEAKIAAAVFESATKEPPVAVKPAPEVPDSAPAVLESSVPTAATSGPESPVPVTESPALAPQIPKSAELLPETTKIDAAPQPVQESVTKPIPEKALPVLEKPAPADSHSIPESPKPISEVAQPILEVPKPADTTQSVVESLTPASEVPAPQEIPKAVSEIPIPSPEGPKPLAESPKPTAEDPKSPAEIPKPAAEALKPAPEIPKPVPESPKPAPESPKPAPESPKSVPEGPKLVPESPKPSPDPPKAVVQESPTTAPDSPKTAPASPALVPESAKTVQEVLKSESVKTVPEVSKPSAEIPVTSPAQKSQVVESQQKDISKSGSAEVKALAPKEPESPTTAEAPKADAPKTKRAEAPKLAPLAEGQKPKESKKPKEAPVPKAETAEAAPPTSPTSASPKQPKPAPGDPSAQESSSGPTPPPRKSTGDKKKTATKTKK